MSEAMKPGTPLPWQFRDDYTTEGFVTIIGNVDGEYDENGNTHGTYDVVCRCEDEYGERLPYVAKNVRYLIYAANNFPKLLGLLEEAITCVEDAVRETSWGQPTFGPDFGELLRAKYEALGKQETRV